MIRTLAVGAAILAVVYASTCSSTPKDIPSIAVRQELCPPSASFFGFMGCACALVFACLGAAYGTAKSGVGVANMGVLHADMVMKSIIPIIMAGVLDFITMSAWSTPMFATPTPDLAVPYAAPRHANTRAHAQPMKP